MSFLFMAPQIIHPSEGLVTSRALERPLAIVAPHVRIAVGLAREVLPAVVAAKLRILDQLARRRSETRGRVVVRVVHPDVLLPVLVGREPEDGQRAGHDRAPVRPLVPLQVRVPGLRVLEPLVEEVAHRPVALEHVVSVQTREVP